MATTITAPALPSNAGIDLGSSDWLFLQIDAPICDDVKSGKPFHPIFQEMQPIAPSQAIWAIYHTLEHGGYIELYLQDDSCYAPPKGTPYIGLCFENGAFTGYGLGSDETAELEAVMDGLKGKKITEDGVRERLHAIFKHYTKRRITVLHHPDDVSGTTVIPDYFNKPVRFHWTEGHTDVVIEHPNTGLEPRRLDSIPYPARPGDPMADLLDAVSEYGADDARPMHVWEASIWAQARA